ncbi:DUF2225 domain-containing protein [Alkalicella caledoniensis]|uniref:DUF2225 domain-containing protein n=1 Tax=Alkalicella caledoniensis TaxID=2731377 RepID=A0A7G9WAK3_ALKCA|nr:DUF2225 domain-containing protein [Alkalicella caledoniensis]QNO15715.1 DUF2225 domain-containing protein [Alkalicella caledoniensis]
MSYLYSTKQDCLNCKKQFESLKVRSKNCIVTHKDSDFCTYYKDAANPYFYEVFVCPDCGFAFTNNFSNKISDDKREIFRQKVTENWYKRQKYSFARNLGAAMEANKLALLTAKIVDEKSWVTAGLALRLGWLYRYQKKQEEELKFLTIARNLYLNAYENDGLRGYESPEINIIYLLGELSARVGDYDEAIKWFNKVTEHETKELHKAIVNQARDRWQDVRNELKKA